MVIVYVSDCLEARVPHIIMTHPTVGISCHQLLVELSLNHEDTDSWAGFNGYAFIVEFSMLQEIRLCERTLFIVSPGHKFNA